MTSPNILSYPKTNRFLLDIDYPSREYKSLPIRWTVVKPSSISAVAAKLEHTLSISLVSQTLEDIPIELVDILKAIEQSRYILTLEDDWDGEGSKAYQPLVWERVVIFLIELFKKALASFNVILDTPHIYQAHEGSIDVLWRNDSYQLLVNFPEDTNSPASFYGDNFNIETIKGTLKHNLREK